jgi:prepilin-type N-terminal cleavage/methylation domain-containing protein
MVRVRGYTLIELMLVVSIIGVVFLIGGGLIVSFTRYFLTSQARQDVQRDARIAFELVSRNLRQAQASSIVIDQLFGQPPYSRITFTKVSGAPIVCYQKDKNLYWVDISTRVISGNLRYLAFAHVRTENDRLVSLAMTLEEDTYERGSKTIQLASDKVRIMND